MRHPTAGPVLLVLGLAFLATAHPPILAAESGDEASAAVAGTLLDENGDPLAGAEVTLHPGGDPRAEPAARATTGAEGRFLLEAPRPGAWTVVARAPERLSVEHPLAPLLPPPPGAPPAPMQLAPVRLPLAADAAEDGPRFAEGWQRTRAASPEAAPLSDHVFRGRVVDGVTGAPIPGAFAWPIGNRHRAVQTGPDGHFEIATEGRPGRIGVRAPAAGYGTAERNLDRSGDEAAPAQSLKLAPAAWLQGSVTDADGAPVAGARVVAVPDDHSDPPYPMTWTGPDGTFVLPGLDASLAHRVVAYSEGRAPAVAEQPPTPTGDDGRPRPAPALDLVLHPPFQVTGRAVDENGEPIGLARATLLRPDLLGDSNLWVYVANFTRTTGADGRFVFEKALPVPSILVVRADGLSPHLRADVDIEAGTGEIDLGDVVLYPEGVLRGRVVGPGGGPVAGAEIYETRISLPSKLRDLFDGQRGAAPLAVSDAEGAFEAGGFLPGEPMRLQAKYGDAASEEQWTFAAPEPLPLELVVASPASISGTVVDADGEPVVGATVSPTSRWTGERSHFRWVRTDGSGRFQVTVAEPGRAILVANARGHASSEPVEVRVAAGEAVEGLEIALPRGIQLSGRVVDRDGRPIEGVEISSPPGSQVVWSDVDGRFAIEDRAAGTVELNLRREGHLEIETSVELVPDGEPVEVVLPTAAVAGTVLRADGSPAVGYRVQLLARDSKLITSTARQVTTATDGSFRFRGVADGEYRITVFGPGGGWEGWDRPEPVVVDDGGSVTGVEVTLPRAEDVSR